MGTTKAGGTTTTQATPTAAEQEMEKLQLEQYKQVQPQQTEMFQNAYNMGNQLLTSFGNQNGSMWQSLIGGVTPEQSQGMITQQDRALRGQFNQAGLYDSGMATSGRMRSAADLSNQNAQFNVGAMQNALNLALSGQAQIQAPMQGATSQLASQLAGLRSTTSNQTSYQTMSPYSMIMGGIQGVGQMASGVGGMMTGKGFCWVASEIFGGWDKPKTCLVRYYIGNIAPSWFRKYYYENGERIAKFIHNKPLLKLVLRPLFEYFAYRGLASMKVGVI